MKEKAQGSELSVQCTPAYLGLAGNLNINFNIDDENWKLWAGAENSTLKQSSAIPTSVEEELSTTTTFIGNFIVRCGFRGHL